MADTLAELAPADPDAQQTVNDFLDYTEFFPSDLIRSLTLIRNLDESYLSSTKSVHDLTTTYGALPTIPADTRPNPQALRKQISLALDDAIRCRESAFAEASRLYEVADRHYSRIVSIKRKLQALPKPPSRDPTPVPPSPQAVRARKAEIERTPRLTLHLDGARHGGSTRTAVAGGPQRHRSRKITVPGEVLPPPNPDSPPPSTVSGWDSSRSPSPVDLTALIKLPKEKIRRIKIPKAHKAQRIRPPGVMGTNVHSAIAGISVSNALAQLEPPPSDAKLGSKYRPWYKLTEYEMAKLRKRMKKNAIWNPSDTMVRRELAELGRGHSNFLKAKAESARTGEPFLNEEPVVQQGNRALVPGEVEMRAIDDEEMKLVNRGMKLNEAKKLKKETQARELAAQTALEIEEAGKQMQLAAQTATEIEEAGRKIKDAGDMFKNLFSRPPNEIGETVIVSPILEKRKESIPTSLRKRKREPSPEVKAGGPEKASESGPTESIVKPPPKKLKLALPAPPPIPVLAAAPSPAPITRTTTIQIPLAPAAPSPPTHAPAPVAVMERPAPPEPISASPKKASFAIAEPPTPVPVPSARPRRTSTAPVKATTPAPQAAPTPAREPSQPTETKRPRSRRSSVGASAASKAASVEPPPKRELRRSSNVNSPSVSSFADAKRSPAPTAVAAVTAPRTSARRGRRPAPGIVTADEDGGSKVSVGRRAVPRKGSRKDGKETKTEGKVEEKPAEEEWGDVDPDEPRYCLCNRVSFGTMIACENEDCEIEWFHLGCVGLEEIPGRRVKWFCPDCRKKLHIDEHGNAAAGGRKR